MNETERRVLSDHRNFIVKNLVWSSELESKLKEEGLITDSTLLDIKNAKTSAEKVGLFLDGVVIRQLPRCYERLCDVIQSCGHVFVADFLRDVVTIPQKFQAKEMYQKLQFLNKLRDHEKRELETYFVDKFRDESLKSVWKDNVRDKEKAVEAKRMLIESYADFKDEAKKWEGTKEELETKLQEYRDEVVALNITITQQNRSLAEAYEKQKKTVDAQVNYTQANENQYQRLKERLQATETILVDVQDKICQAIKSRPRKARNPQEEAILEQNKFAFAIEDLDRLLTKHEELKEVGIKYFDLCEQRDYILAHMGHEPDGGPSKISLLDAYKEFAVRIEENMTEMKEKLEVYGEMVETQKKEMEVKEKKKNAFQMGATVWQSAIMNVMRNQLQDTKKELRMQESRLQMTEQENKKLKATVKELEIEISKLKRAKPHIKQSKELLSVDILPSNASERSVSSMEDLSDHEEYRREKARILPRIPLVSQSTPTPRKGSLVKPRQLGLVNTTNNVSNRYFNNLPEGLTTAPVKLMDSRKQHIHALGDLKSMNSRSKFEKSLNPGKVHY